ncbi:hypothetical protein [Burkholderia gladioli]|uniref:hypothetical protein n=1 Tax=Burkholderia gladioli TaxID=28095 RepID=UPI003B986BC6
MLLVEVVVLLEVDELVVDDEAAEPVVVLVVPVPFWRPWRIAASASLPPPPHAATARPLAVPSR